MNFFKSVFSDDPDPPQSQSESESQSNNADSDPDSGDGNNWDFGGLIQTLTAKSESIIETYRRDLQEFRTGLKNEIEVAHDSVGEIRNTVIKGTAQIISQGKDAILAVHLDSDSDKRDQSPRGLDSKRYSRFDAQVRAIQGDVSTYTEVPEDLNEFNEWKLGFSLDGKSEEIESLLKENDAMENVHKRVVPNTLDHETFWYRYYYKVYKLKKAEDVRTRLVRRMSREEEELSWDVEEDDDVKEGYEGEGKSQLVTNKEIGGENKGKRVDTDLQIGASGTSNEGETKRSSVEEVQRISVEEVSKEEKRDNLLQSKGVEKSEVVHEMGGAIEETKQEAGVDKASKLQVADAVNKDDSDEKVVMERKAGEGKSSSKNIESSVVEGQHVENEEEEDLEWDDIEDLSGIDEKKATESVSGSTSKDDLCKRLSVAEEDEDLSWDIEDDDEPAKA